MGWNQNRAQEKALQYFWTDRASVFVTEKVKDPDTGITDFQRVPLYRDIPCKLSFSTQPPVEQGDTGQASQQVKLFLSRGYELPPGCEIQVDRDGKQFGYKLSGLPAVFSFHQEIELEQEDRP